MNDNLDNELLINWLNQKKKFGIILPDGWFGRPMDNLHEVTWWIERTNKFIIEIDSQLYITLTKPIKLNSKKDSLIISNFLQCIFDYQGYGDMRAHSKMYNAGEITFVNY